MSQHADVLERPLSAELHSVSMTQAQETFSEGGHAQSRWSTEDDLRLVQQLFLLQPAGSPQVTVFTGVSPQSGCSRICAGVGEILAKDNRKRVCLVEANFRSPVLAEMFGVSPRQGLSEMLVEKGPATTFLQKGVGENLWLLSAGALSADSPSLLRSEQMRDRLAELRASFDFIIIDTPPLRQYADAIAIGQLSDGVVMVLEAACTRRDEASSAAGALRAARIPVLAAVLSNHTNPIPEKIYSKL